MPKRIFHRLSRAERTFLADALRQETVGGALLLVAAVIALIWANSSWHEAYADFRGARIGPESLHLDLTLEQWTADGLLAIFFFVAGLELKRELVVGELRNPADAAIPMAAAVGGMIVPAIVFLAVTRGAEGTADGWAVPIATDIAFALAVLAVIGSALPAAMRAFLLTLAVVDDLGAIIVIALFYSASIDLAPLLWAAAGLALWWFLQRRRVDAWLVYVPLAVVVWVFVHESGIHATAAGVALGLLTRVRPEPDEHVSPAEHLEHNVRPISAGVAVPLFAFFAAGVRVAGSDLGGIAGDVVVVGIVAGLVVGKAVGVFGGAYLVARFTRAELSTDLTWEDVFGVAILSGIGFTVSLLIGNLAFAGDLERLEHVKVAVLAGSLLAGTAAAFVLRHRHRVYARLQKEEDDAGLGGRPPGIPEDVAG